MKTSQLLLVSLALVLGACSRQETAPAASADSSAAAPDGGGQSAVADDDSQKDIVKVAVGSKDHTTLVVAVKAAELVDVLANTGPFTVFAPTNAAFDKLPAGTVAELVKPAKKEDLRNILQYHVAVAVYKPEMLKDGQTLNMANGDNVKISVKDGKIVLNGTATVVGSVPASNGIIHVIDTVLLPPPAK
ncbi:MAG: fasciclin domain-containing protein [Verrucomicrobia bacterium]|nr:fasciclin domain-containing protein [Verrucomicrobiota bacterium]